MSFQWLEEEFLGYLTEWSDSVQKREGFTPAEKKLMMLPNETQEGLRITGELITVKFCIHHSAIIIIFHNAVNSFVEVTRHLLLQPGVNFILSEHFCQDPLESFFGHQRSCGGRNDNPTIQQFLKSTVSLRMQGSVALKQLAKGSYRKRPVNNSIPIDDTPLPKRRRKQGH